MKDMGSSHNPIITADQVDYIPDISLIQYHFHQDKGELKVPSILQDTIADIPSTSTSTFDYSGAINVRNNRSITFNIPAIDALSRSNPYVRKAVNYLASKPLVNGIDINSPNGTLTSEEENMIQEEMQNLYPAIKDVLSKGINYGGAAGLIYIDGEDTEEEMMKPLLLSNIRKNSFLGIKPLARWFQVEPALEKELIKEIGNGTGFDDASMIGMPMFYHVNLSGGMMGTNTRQEFLVHASRLLIFNQENPSFIETQVERYWGPSIIEIAWNDLVKDSRLWNATTKSAEKNNIGLLKIDGLSLATQLTVNAKQRVSTKLALLKLGDNTNVFPIDSKDEFEFVQSSIQGYAEIMEMSNRRLAGAFTVPVSVFFPNSGADEQDSSYIQSLSQLEDMRLRKIGPWYKKLLPFVIKSKLGRKVANVSFTFNPIETQTTKEKSETAKTNAETLEILYRNGAIDKAGFIMMIDNLAKNPEYLSQNMNSDYMKEVLDKAKQGEFITANTDKIELAKALNQFEGDEKGVSGVEHPQSADGGKDKGGDPTKSDQLIKKGDSKKGKGKE